MYSCFVLSVSLVQLFYSSFRNSIKTLKYAFDMCCQLSHCGEHDGSGASVASKLKSRADKVFSYAQHRIYQNTIRSVYTEDICMYTNVYQLYKN